MQTGLFGFPRDGRVLWGPLPLTSPLSVSLRVSSSRFGLKRDLLLFPVPFMFASFLKPHESPREHCHFRGALSTISLFAICDRLLCIAFKIPLGFSLQATAR